ncbi:hypothetical protein ACFL27_28305, partial [candidate division CSSED10-310 bacterium]
METVKKSIPYIYFGFFALLSCLKVGYLLRFSDKSFEHLLELIRVIFITLFFYLVLFSYLMRSNAQVKAQGVLERWLPILVTVAVPVSFALLLQQ